MSNLWILARWARNAVVVVFALAGIGLLIPGSPAYLPSLLDRYSHIQDGHTLGYWLRALHRPDLATRRRAIFAVGAIGPDAAEAVPVLAAILTGDADVESRRRAALALAKLAPASASAAPALARALEEDEIADVRMNAALALGELREHARPAVPALIRALQRRANRTNLETFTVTIQEAAALALGRSTAGTPDGVPALLEALDRARTVNKRRIVARSLGEVGPAAQAAEPRLRALLADNSQDVREAAQEALEKIGGE